MISKISERNAASIMGKINNFFKHQVREDLGIISTVIGHEPVYWDSEYVGDRNIYEEKQTFRPVQLKCEFHHLYKSYLYHKSKELSERFGIKVNEPEYFITNDISSRIKDGMYVGPIFAISSKYANGCKPVFIGQKIKFKGNELIFIQPEIPHIGIDGKSSFLFSNPTTTITRYVMMPYTKDEENQYLTYEINNAYLDNIYDEEYAWYDYYPGYYSSLMKCITHHIYHSLEGIIPKIVSGDFLPTEINIGRLTKDNDFPDLIERTGDIEIIINPISIMEVGIHDENIRFTSSKNNVSENNINKFAYNLVTKMFDEEIREEGVDDSDIYIDYGDFDYEDFHSDDM